MSKAVEYFEEIIDRTDLEPCENRMTKIINP